MTGNGVSEWIGSRTIDPRPDMNVTPNPPFTQPVNPPPRRLTPAQSSYPPYGKPPQHDYNNQEHNLFDGSTVNSDFDDTVSIANNAEPQPRRVGSDNEEHHEVDRVNNYDQHMDVEDQGQVGRDQHGYADDDEDFGYQQVPLQPHAQAAHQRAQSQQVHFKQSQTPTLVGPNYEHLQISPNRRKGTAISGRFSGAASTSRNAPQEAESSHKRARSQDRYMSPIVTKLTQSADQTEKEERISNTQQLSPISSETSDETTTRLRSDEESDGESTDDANSLQRQPQLQSRPISIHPPESETTFDLGRIKPDYEDGVLRQMTYAELKDQSFDEIPKANESITEPDISLSNLSLPERLAAIVEQLYTADQRENEKRQQELAELFTAMSRDEWEESGDWFLTRFSDIVNKLRDARREKRRIVAEFETEMEERELAVRESLQAYSEDMERMKEGAETVIAGKRI
ncbi:hypothetical protein ACMFMF_004788 [Clarireedia jacksonii]